MSVFGKNIRKIRSVRGLTQAQLAEMIDVSRGQISSYEEGRAEPKIETILKTAEVFHINTDLLLLGNLTVNQLAGFTLPDVSKSKPASQQEQEPRLFRFLPRNTREIPAHELAPNPWVKKNDIVLAVPAKVLMGKMMIIHAAKGSFMGRISFEDAKNVSIDTAEKTLLQPRETLEVLGIYSPVQNLSPLEEKLLNLEARVQKLEMQLKSR